MFVSVFQSLEQAFAHCQMEGGPDSYPANIESEDENLHINARMQALSGLPVTPNGYWIGLTKNEGIGEAESISKEINSSPYLVYDISQLF